MGGKPETDRRGGVSQGLDGNETHTQTRQLA